MKLLLSILFIISLLVILYLYIDFRKYIKSITDKVLDESTSKKTKRKITIYSCCNTIIGIFIAFLIILFRHFY